MLLIHLVLLVQIIVHRWWYFFWLHRNFCVSRQSSAEMELRWIELIPYQVSRHHSNLTVKLFFFLQVRLSLRAKSQCPKRQQIKLLLLKKRRHLPRPPKRPKRFKRRSWREPMALVLRRFAQQCISEGHWPSGQPGILNSPGNQLQLAIVWVSEFIWVTQTCKASWTRPILTGEFIWVTQTCKASSGLDQISLLSNLVKYSGLAPYFLN